MFLALIGISFFFQRAIVIEVNPRGITEDFLFGGFSRSTPWSDVQSLKGGQFRARLVLVGKRKMLTVAMFDPNWGNRKTVRAIQDRLGDSTKTRVQ